ERIAAALQLARRFQRLLSGSGAQRGVVLPVTATKVATDGGKNLRIIVNGQDDGLVHSLAPEPSATTAGRATRNSVRPGRDSTLISPSLWRIRRLTMSSPRPMP